jgi:hypothetical protein
MWLFVAEHFAWETCTGHPAQQAMTFGAKSNPITHRSPFSSFVPHSQNYGGQAGRIPWRPDPGLKPWAIIYNPSRRVNLPITTN